MYMLIVARLDRIFSEEINAFGNRLDLRNLVEK